MIIYRERDSLIRIFSYPDSQLGNRGVRISEGSLYIGVIADLYAEQLFVWLFRHVQCDMFVTNCQNKLKLLMCTTRIRYFEERRYMAIMWLSLLGKGETHKI